MWSTFFRDERGSIGTVLALGSLTMVGAISASLDYTRMTNTRAALSAAADAAALAAAQAEPANAAAIARSVFEANFRDSRAITSFSASTVTRGDSQAYRIEVSANVQMTLAQAVGFTSAPVRSVSEVMIGNDYDIQVALVLDVTGSMEGQKLTDMKKSASDMTNTLFDKLKRSNQVKMAVVPFAQYVNIGTGNRGQSWATNTANYSTTREQCGWRRRGWSLTWECRDITENFVWDGCVGSRSYPLNVRDDGYAGTRVPGVHNVSCPEALLTLSTSRPSVLGKIENLVAEGATYIPAGLMWGWAVLSPGEPFNEPTDNKRTTKRYLVLMTDGENTISPTYPTHNGDDSTTANTLTAELCTNIKAADIEVFTIAFEVNTNTVKNLLRNCATSTDRFFDAGNSTQLAAAFESITKQMSNLRISR